MQKNQLKNEVNGELYQQINRSQTVYSN